MKRFLYLLGISVLFLMSSCHTRVVTEQKPLRANSLDLYQNYVVQTNDAKTYKMKILKVDEEKIYGKTKKDETIEIKKEDIREIKKFNLLATIGIAAVAALAFIFIPV